MPGLEREASFELATLATPRHATHPEFCPAELEAAPQCSQALYGPPRPGESFPAAIVDLCEPGEAVAYEVVA